MRFVIYQTAPTSISSIGIEISTMVAESRLEVPISQTIPTRNVIAEMACWVFIFLLVACVVVSCAPAAFASKAPAIGAPLLGVVSS